MGFQVVPSDANFVLFGGFADAPATWQALAGRTACWSATSASPAICAPPSGLAEENDAFLAVSAVLATTAQ